MLVVNCSVTAGCSPIALILELVWFQYIENTDVWAKCYSCLENDWLHFRKSGNQVWSTASDQVTFTGVPSLGKIPGEGTIGKFLHFNILASHFPLCYDYGPGCATWGEEQSVMKFGLLLLFPFWAQSSCSTTGVTLQMCACVPAPGPSAWQELRSSEGYDSSIYWQVLCMFWLIISFFSW